MPRDITSGVKQSLPQKQDVKQANQMDIEKNQGQDAGQQIFQDITQQQCNDAVVNQSNDNNPTQAQTVDQTIDQSSDQDQKQDVAQKQKTEQKFKSDKDIKEDGKQPPPTTQPPTTQPPTTQPPTTQPPTTQPPTTQPPTTQPPTTQPPTTQPPTTQPPTTQPPPTQPPTTAPPCCCATGSGQFRQGNTLIATFHFENLDSCNLANGTLTYSDKRTTPPFNFDSTSISSVTCVGNTATITGQGIASQGSSATNTTFTLIVTDNATPSGGLDTFSITLGTGYSFSFNVTSGNINVGPTCIAP